MPRRTLLGLLATIVVLAVPTAVVGGAVQTHAAGDRAGIGRRRRDRRQRRDDARRRTRCEQAATPSTPRSPRRPCSASQSRSRAGIGGGGFMVIRTPDGEVTTIDSREKAPAAMRPDSFLENGAPLPFNDARYSGLSGGVPGTVAGWDRALREYGTWSLGRALERGDRRRARGIRDRPDVLRPGAGERRLVRRHHLLRGALPRPRRHRRTTSARSSAIPTWRAPTSASRHLGAEGLLPRRDRRRARRAPSRIRR